MILQIQNTRCTNQKFNTKNWKDNLIIIAYNTKTNSILFVFAKSSGENLMGVGACMAFSNTCNCYLCGSCHQTLNVIKTHLAQIVDEKLLKWTTSWWFIFKVVWFLCFLTNLFTLITQQIRGNIPVHSTPILTCRLHSYCIHFLSLFTKKFRTCVKIPVQTIQNCYTSFNAHLSIFSLVICKPRVRKDRGALQNTTRNNLNLVDNYYIIL